MKPSDTKTAARPDPISMRLPEKLKTSLTEAAGAAGRSLNAEIRFRLEWSLQAELQSGGSMLATGQTDAMSDMEARIKEACMSAIAEHFIFLENVIEARIKERSKKA
jgi:hypothetical protein